MDKFQAPVITQNRVAYFYTNENKNLNISHSFNESLTASDQMKPLFNHLIGQIMASQLLSQILHNITNYLQKIFRFT
jgi:hypothetical protein